MAAWALLGAAPASTPRRHLSYTHDEIAELVQRLRAIPPEQR